MDKKPITILELETILNRPHKGYVILPDGQIQDTDSRIQDLQAENKSLRETLEVAKNVALITAALARSGEHGA